MIFTTTLCAEVGRVWNETNVDQLTVTLASYKINQAIFTTEVQENITKIKHMRKCTSFSNTVHPTSPHCYMQNPSIYHEASIKLYRND